MPFLEASVCDFQIHSPRDPHYRHWSRERMTLEGLYDWSKTLLAECRDRHVGTIAVTDHHDLWASLVAYHVAVAEYPDVHVIPGMEITSSTKLQAILLLDSSLFHRIPTPFNLPETERTQTAILSLLGQPVTSPEDPTRLLSPTRHSELVSLSELDADARPTIFRLPATDRVSRSLEQIADDLERHYYDHFVLIPNVENNEHGVVGNPAGRELYLNAPSWFVGGFISGGNSTDPNILEGRLAEWGKQQVTLVRTSDQRGKDNQSLIADYFGNANNTSCLFLSEPTAISVTQALISGLRRRVFSSSPPSPSPRLSSLTIDNCPLFSASAPSFQFSPHMNSIIGGRGTGKSLIISALVRLFGLDASWLQRVGEEPGVSPIWERRHRALFDRDGPFCGHDVSISAQYVTAAGVHYRLTLDEPAIHTPDIWTLECLNEGTWEVIDRYDQVPSQLEVRPLAFLQGQMSALTTEVAGHDDLTRLIEGPIREKRAALRRELRELADIVRRGVAASRELSGLQQSESELKTQMVQKQNERDQYLELASGGLTESQKAAVALSTPLAESRDGAVSLHNVLASALTDLREAVQSLSLASDMPVSQLEHLMSQRFEEHFSHPGFDSNNYLTELLAIRAKVVGEHLSAVDGLTARLDALDLARQEFRENIGNLIETCQSAVQMERHRLEAIEHVNRLQREIGELDQKILSTSRRIEEIERRGDIASGRNARTKYDEVVRRYSSELIQRSKEITADPSLRLIVQVAPGGKFEPFVEALQKQCHGAFVRSLSWQKLHQILAESARPAEIISSLVSSMIASIEEGAVDIVPSMWSEFDVTKSVYENILEQSEVDDWIELSVVLAEDRVDIRYKRESGKTPIPLEFASAGERAVELLRLALMTTVGPVIIDQPEDDLDNDFLARNLVDLVHCAKGDNQLIFSSHSANLVVHGDSNGIFVMDTDETPDGMTSCLCRSVGTIDQVELCEAIEVVMEGGRVAFEQRRRKYHETIDPRRGPTHRQ